MYIWIGIDAEFQQRETPLHRLMLRLPVCTAQKTLNRKS